MGKKDEIRVSMAEALDRWRDPNYTGDPLTSVNWRLGVAESMRDGDTKAMRRKALPRVQAEIIRLSLEAKSEQTRLSAGHFLMGQEGEGAVQKVEQSHSFDKMPEDQLMALVRSKMQDLQQLSPGFNLDVLLRGIKDGDVVYAKPGTPGVDFSSSEGAVELLAPPEEFEDESV